MLKINYVTIVNEGIPAFRYRMSRIGDYLDCEWEASTVPVKSDIYVFSKPYFKSDKLFEKHLEMASRLRFVFDICDDLFIRSQSLSDYTKAMIEMAEAVTVPTQAMYERVLAETDIKAEIISDPYEFPERPIKDISEPKVMWFGMHTSLRSINFESFPYPLEVVTLDGDDVRKYLDSRPYEIKFTEWSLDNLSEAFERNNICIVPSTLELKNQCKSPNRVIEAIRSGLSVVASPIPSYKQFDIALEWDVRKGLKDVKQTTPELQKYVRDNFDISVIGEQWNKLFTRVSQSRKKSSSISDVETKSSMAG
jgi:hypothetical protein